MPDRKFSDGDSYRYGFNGKEDDGDWGTQNIQDYGFRLYNPSIGKFLSVDPLTASYPWYTPYQFAGNKPIKFIDLDGLEEGPAPGGSATEATKPSPAIGGGSSDRTAKTAKPSSSQQHPHAIKTKWPWWLGGRYVKAGVDIFTEAWNYNLRIKDKELENLQEQLEKANKTIVELEEKVEEAKAQIEYLEAAEKHNSKTFTINSEGVVEEVASASEESEATEEEKDDDYTYVHRAMSNKEFTKTGGLIKGKFNEDGSIRGDGPFITTDKNYLTNQKSFINKGGNAKKYDIIVTYKVKVGTLLYLDLISIQHPAENITQKSADELRPIRKIEKGAVNYGFPGNNGDAHFNGQIKEITTEPIK